ncbi:TetR/AcrR family transcriptional regulator C-terminal domain-containing protein [Streptomyces lateritius]
MRRVAEALGVETMALYRYTASKDELLDGLVEMIFIELEERLPVLDAPRDVVPDAADAARDVVPDAADGARDASVTLVAPAPAPATGPAPPTSPAPPGRGAEPAAASIRGALHAVAREMYRVAVAHPNVVPLCATRPLVVPLARRPQAVLRCHERLLALLLEAGVEPTAALRFYRSFLSWVLGFIVIDLRAVVDDPSETEPAFRLGLHRLAARDFPRLRALGPELAHRGGEPELIAGVDALIDAAIGP